MGIAVADVKPRVTAPVLRVPGTRSVEVTNAMATPAVSWPPRATVAAAVGNNTSMLDSTDMLPAVFVALLKAPAKTPAG